MPILVYPETILEYGNIKRVGFVDGLAHSHRTMRLAKQLRPEREYFSFPVEIKNWLDLLVEAGSIGVECLASLNFRELCYQRDWTNGVRDFKGLTMFYNGKPSG